MGSPASRSVMPDSEQERPTTGGSGPPTSNAFAWFDPASSSWRTSQLSLLTPTHSEPSLVTFTYSGSMRSGQLFPHAPWVPHTHGAGCSLWPTARTVMSRAKCHLIDGKPRENRNLEEVVAARGETGGYLNPRWTEWHMGFPFGWCEVPCTPLETP